MLYFLNSKLYYRVINENIAESDMFHESGVELTLKTDPLKVQELSLFAQGYKVMLTEFFF